MRPIAIEEGGAGGRDLTVDVGGVALPATAFLPASRASGVVVFVAGHAAVPRMYRIEARPYVEAGWAFATFVHRAHGGVAGRFSYREAALDAQRVAAAVASAGGLAPRSRRFYVAHSAAALGLVRALLDGALAADAVALACPALSRDIFAHHAGAGGAAREAGAAMWGSQLRGDGEALRAIRDCMDDPRWIYHPERLTAAVVARLRGRPIRWSRFRTDDWSEVLRDFHEVLPWDTLDWGRITVPTLTLLDGADEWIPADAIGRVHAALGSRRKELVLLAGANHMLDGHWPEASRRIVEFFRAAAAAAS